MRERLQQVKAEKGSTETNQTSNCTYIQVTQLVLSTHLVAKRERSPEAVGGLLCQQVCNKIAELERRTQKHTYTRNCSIKAGGLPTWLPRQVSQIG